MRGWILYRYPQHALRPEAYGIHRFLATAREIDLDLRVVSPNELDIIIDHRHENPGFLLNGKEASRPDFVLSRMGAGTTYFALAVMRQLESFGIYVINRADHVSLVRDKLHTLQVLAQHSLPVAKSMLAKNPIDVNLVEEHLGFPVIVKTLSGSQGRGVFLCETRGKFEDLIAMITTSQGNPNFVIQEFVHTSIGRDLRVIVIGGHVAGCMTRIAASGSFKANYSRGGRVEAYPVTPQIAKLAVEAAEVLGLEIAGVDLLFDGANFKICEVNSSPGFKGMEECLDVNIPQEIFSYINSRVKLLEPAVKELSA